VLINNKGILKKENESIEKHDPAYAAAVRITAPAEGKFTELVAQERLKEERAADKKIVALTVPPGEVRVLEVRNVRETKNDSAADKKIVARIILPGKARVLEMKTNSAAVCAWSFDEGQGTNAVDSSGNGYNGTILGAQYITNRSGYALAFNGKDSHVKVEIPAKYPLTEGAFEAWACPTAGTGLGRGQVMHTDNVFIYLSSNCWGAMIYDETSILKVQGPAARNNQWAHLVITWSSDNVARFYVDGQEVELAVPLRYINPLGLSKYNGKIKRIMLYVGMFSPANGGPFNGQIDDVRVYDRELTAAEIQQRYQDGLKQR